MKAQAQDLIELLLDDHRLMDGLLDRLEEEDDPGALRRLFLDLGELLAGHEAIEQALVFPALDVEGHPHERLDEHGEINQLLDEMRGLSAVGHGFRKRACAVVLELRAHCRAEEELVFPLLRSTVTADRLVELAHEAADVRRRATSFPVVPTA